MDFRRVLCRSSPLMSMAAMLIKGLPGIEKHVVVADNARPELISHLKKPDPKNGRPCIPKMEACAKGKGSVEDGISFMKAFDEIVVHARCKETSSEERRERKEGGSTCKYR